MERRGLNIRKGFLKVVLPIFRALPLPVASRFVSGIGRLEYRLSPSLRQSFDDGGRAGSNGSRLAVGSRARSVASWRATMSCGERETCCSTAFPIERALEMFTVEGREHLDAAMGQGRGCIVLANHFGAHLLPAHWLFRENYPVRFYMERPRHISRYMSRHFQTDGPLGQDKLFISRQGVPADSASSILRAARAIKAGLLLYLAGDVRWTGKLTETAQFLGRQHAILDDLGRAGGDDGSAGRDGLLPDGARRTIPHRVSPGVSRSQGSARARRDRRSGSGISSRFWKSRSASIPPTATTISSGAIWTRWLHEISPPGDVLQRRNATWPPWQRENACSGRCLRQVLAVAGAGADRDPGGLARRRFRRRHRRRVPAGGSPDVQPGAAVGVSAGRAGRHARPHHDLLFGGRTGAFRERAGALSRGGGLWPAALAISAGGLWYSGTPGPTFDGWYGLGWRTIANPDAPDRRACRTACRGDGHLRHHRGERLCRSGIDCGISSARARARGTL